MDLRPGTTPIIFLSNYIATKLENKNPSGSIKDRVVESKLNALQQDGTISRSNTLVSVLNGEFAVSFAFFCAKKGFKCIIISPKNINKVHLSLCKLFGADVEFTESSSLKNTLKQKDAIISSHAGAIYIDFYNRQDLKKLYELTFCQELNLQIKSSHKNIKNIFLYSESGILAESLKSAFPSARIYNVKISNGLFDFNGHNRDFVNNLNIFSEEMPDKKIFEKQIDFKLKEVAQNIKNVAEKSGLIMDYRTSACYLAAKEYPCINEDVSLIVFYENGERYLEEIFCI